MKNELEFKGIDAKKTYLNETVNKLESKENHKKKKQESFGWDVFNDETLYRSYKKRCQDVPFYKDVYEKQMKEGEDETGLSNEERLNNMVQDLEKNALKKSKFSRRRTHIKEEDVYHINERNRIYNKKLQRNFGEYVKDIKSNLERGTAS